MICNRFQLNFLKNALLYFLEQALNCSAVWREFPNQFWSERSLRFVKIYTYTDEIW